jgi:hypothetical protein
MRRCHLKSIAPLRRYTCGAGFSPGSKTEKEKFAVRCALFARGDDGRTQVSAVRHLHYLGQISQGV